MSGELGNESRPATSQEQVRVGEDVCADEVIAAHARRENVDALGTDDSERLFPKLGVEQDERTRSRRPELGPKRPGAIRRNGDLAAPESAADLGSQPALVGLGELRRCP